jgi:nucleotide-binding universal stress UspA family protein
VNAMKKEIEKIVLVPTDFSEVADYAIDHAAGIAKIMKGKVALLHVINKETKAYLKKEKLSEESIKEKLKAISEKIEKKCHVKLDYIAEEGSIFTTIGKVTRDIGASIVVMGTHGKIGVQHLIGSFALKVIENSPVPVIVVQEKDFGKGYKNIVLPVDETSETKQKVNWAMQIAKIFDSTIHLFGIRHDDEFLKKQVANNMSQIKNILAKNSIKHTDKMSSDKHANYGKSIVIYCDYMQADLVMIMTNPDQMLPSFILSPWAENVIFNNSKIPAMCVNPVDLDITYYTL